MSAMTAESKAVLRPALRARRRDLNAARDRAADALRLAEQVLGLVAEHAPASGVCRVAAYVALPTEPPTDRIIDALLDAGHEVILPVLLADRSLDWTRHPDSALLGPGAIATADLVLAPGLAVDRSGVRVGQGGGSYDRALALRRPGVPVVTLLHDGELRDEPLPVEEHDVAVDAVLSVDAGLVSCAPRG